MACGIPVIGSAVGGIKYTVADGETGFLVPPRDPVALASRIARCFEQPGLLPVLGELAARRARALFTWDRVAGLLEAVYDEVLEGTPTGLASWRGASTAIAATLLACHRVGREPAGPALVSAHDGGGA